MCYAPSKNNIQVGKRWLVYKQSGILKSTQSTKLVCFQGSTRVSNLGMLKLTKLQMKHRKQEAYVAAYLHVSSFYDTPINVNIYLPTQSPSADSWTVSENLIKFMIKIPPPKLHCLFIIYVYYNFEYKDVELQLFGNFFHLPRIICWYAKLDRYRGGKISYNVTHYIRLYCLLKILEQQIIIVLYSKIIPKTFLYNWIIKRIAFYALAVNKI